MRMQSFPGVPACGHSWLTGTTKVAFK